VTGSSSPTDASPEDPYAAAAAAADRLRELTGVEQHDVALVLGSGWVPAADLLGTPRPTWP
jgi:purine-nucleoside phosphorylase